MMMDDGYPGAGRDHDRLSGNIQSIKSAQWKDQLAMFHDDRPGKGRSGVIDELDIHK